MDHSQTGLVRVRCASMRLLLGWAAGTALLVLALDQSLKTFVRTHLLPCSVPTVVVCDRAELGSLWLLRASNAGSAMGLGQGWWVWVLLACSGVLLILLYARWLNDRGWLAGLAIGLQLGGALSNLL